MKVPRKPEYRSLTLAVPIIFALMVGLPISSQAQIASAPPGGAIGAPQLPPTGIGAGQVFQLNIAAPQFGPNSQASANQAPCHATLSLVNEDNEPLRGSASKDVLLQPGFSDSLVFDPSTIGLGFGSRILFRPVITPYSDSGPCIASSVVGLHVSTPGGLARLLIPVIQSVQPCPPGWGFSPQSGCFLPEITIMMPTIVTLGWGQTLEMYVTNLGGGLCLPGIDIRRTDTNADIPIPEPGPLAIGQTFTTALRSSTVGLTFGRTVQLAVGLGAGYIDGALVQGCGFGATIVDTATALTLQVLPLH